MKAQGFEYVPVDPFAQQQALTGKARITDEEFIKQFGYGISTLLRQGQPAGGPQRADPQQALGGRPRRLRPRARGRQPRRRPSPRRSTRGDFSELGGCTKEASDAAFGGAAVLTALVEQARRARRAHHPGPADGAGQREVVGVHAGEGLPLRGARRDRRGPAPSASGRSSEPASRPGTTTPPDAGTSFDRAALTALQREEVTDRETPTSSARSRRSCRSSRRSARSTRRTFRKQNQQAADPGSPGQSMSHSG